MDFWGAQHDFVTSSATLRLFQVGRSGGKTFSHVWLARQFTKTYPGEVWVSTEPTYRMAEDILRPEFVRQFEASGEWGTWATWRASDNKFQLANGSEIRLRSCEEPDKLRGQGIGGFGIDEAAFCPYAAFTNLAMAMRPASAGKRKPPSITPPPWLPEYLAICTTTPMGLSWVHYTFTAGARPDWAAPYIADDPALVATLGKPSTHYGSSLNNPHLPEHSKAIMLATNPPGSRGYRQEILGEAVSWEGLVYECFDFAKHVRAMPPDTVIVRRVCGVDWGWQNPGVILCLCMDEHGVLWITREIVESYRQPSWWAEEMARLADEGFSEAYCDPSEPSNIELMCSQGVNAMKANNEVRPGIGVVSGALGNGQLFIDPSCQQTIREFGLYCYQVTRTGETRPDVIQKGNDHCMDALRYAAMGFQRGPSLHIQLL